MTTAPIITPQNRQHYLALAQQARDLLALRRDPTPWIAANLHIRTKTREVVPLKPNWVQRDYLAQRSPRDIILKARQVGITTMASALFFADAVLNPNTTSVMLAHNRESSEQIFGIVHLFWDRLPPEERERIGKPKYRSRRELYWPGLNSRFLVNTAGATTFGRGQTVQNLHASEFAIWPDAEGAFLAAAEAVPDDGRIVIESTANGMGTPFHDRWFAAVEGRSRFRPVFYVWFECGDYWARPTQGEIAVWSDQLRQLRLPARVGEAPSRIGAEAAPLAGPLTPLTDQEIDLVRAHHLTLGQIKWARLKRADLREKFDQEYPTDPVSCFLASGRCIFDTQNLMAIARRIASEPGPESMTSVIVGGEAISLPPATLLVWKRPEPEHYYCIGADIGEGLADGDASCCVVLDRASGEQVAELHGRVSPERFAILLNALGRYYRRAEIGVERNNHGHSTLNTLRNVCLYPLLYYHVAYDSGHGNPRAVQLGWPTNSSTKPILVDDLSEAVNTGSLLVRNQLLVNEAMTFVLDDNGNAGAQPGKFDDRIMAAGIAWQVRKRPRARWSPARPPGM